MTTPDVSAILDEIEKRDASWRVPCATCGQPFYGDGDYMHVPVEKCPLVLKGKACGEPKDHHEYIAAASAPNDTGDQAGFDRRRLLAALRLAVEQRNGWYAACDGEQIGTDDDDAKIAAILRGEEGK